jgi:hypothetical protein
MADYSHIFLHEGNVEKINFSPKTGGDSSPAPSRDVHAHAVNIRLQYESCVNDAIQQLDARRMANKPSANGFYLDIELTGKHPPFEKLDGVRGPQLMAINGEDNSETTIASVYLQTKKKDWLNQKLDKYEDPVEDGKKPKNQTLINSIETIATSTARSLFPNKDEYDDFPPQKEGCFELWIDVVDDREIENSKRVLNQIGISLAQDVCLRFEKVTVLLVNATKEALDDIPLSLDYVEAIKYYYSPVDLLYDDEQNREWAQLIQDDIVRNVNDDSVIVGVLDGGINNGHPMIEPFLPDDRRATVIPNTNVFHEGYHGTGMAGLIEYGDLTEFLGRHGHLEINHSLASVKILSREPNEKYLYGKITEDAILRADQLGAKITCMAVTEEQERNDGSPSSWSAAIDKALFNNGQCDRLMVVSAGNTNLNDIDSDDYRTSLVNSPIQSPGQSQNAIVVGAYTQRSICHNPDYTTIAPPNGVSPLTRTSWFWRRSNIKPDIVMEGGNVAHHDVLGNVIPVELGLVTTDQDFNQTPLMPFNATSAATALAARLAARILTANPGISLLSVRALMIHSASWTNEMKALSQKPADIMKYCGYGVPNERWAMASGDTRATFIMENELIPFNEDCSYKEMHFYSLPWPKELLLQMHDENVKLRVTLSYYIEPSPSFKNDYDKYRLSSAGLIFDVKTPTESKEQFIARKNKKKPVKETSNNNSERWEIGIKLRGNSTLQSDWFECTARELAECNEIAIFPQNGWWKYRKIDNVYNRIKYSLVVTIETTETEIYDAVQIAVGQAIPVEVGR